MFKRILPILCVFVLMLTLFVPFVSAATVSYVDPPEVEGYDLIIVYKEYNDGRYTAVYVTEGMFTEFDTAFYNEDVGRWEFFIRADTGARYMTKRLMDNGTWGDNGTTNAMQKAYPGSVDDMVYAIETIYDWETGEPFFPLPLWWTTQLTSLETLQGETIPQTMRTISILVLCGVGCLALLIGCPLLLKVLRRFLG